MQRPLFRSADPVDPTGPVGPADPVRGHLDPLAVVFGAVLVLAGLLQLAIAAVSPLLRNASEALQFAVTLLVPQLLTGAVIFGVAQRLRGAGPVTGLLALRPVSAYGWKTAAKLFLVLYLAMLFLSNSAAVLARRFGCELPVQDTVRAAVASSWPAFGVIVLSGVVVAPVVEELVFRHVLFRQLEKVLPRGLVMTAGAALFAVFHFNLLQFPALLVMGLMLQLVYLRDRSLLTPIAMHAANNALAMLLVVLIRLGVLAIPAV